ncbi:MAG: hypothetical protein ACYC8T_02315 [Myxococcaceae bacterium]
MSEVSDSLHLLGSSMAVTIRAVESAGATALVLPQQGRHVTLVTNDAKKISAAAPGPAVWWDYSADLALEVELLDKGEVKGKISIDFERADHHTLEGDEAWRSLAQVSLQSLREQLRPGLTPDAKAWAKLLAEALGLTDVSWVAGRDLNRPERLEELKQRYPEATLLRGGGKMRWLTDAERARRGEPDSEQAARAEEKVLGAPLLAPPQAKRLGAWTVKGKGTIELVLENIGGEGKGISVELESELFAKKAVELVSVEVDGQPLKGALEGAKWSASRPDLPWPAACDPAKPRATLKRRVVIALQGKGPAAALLMVRINPAPAPEAKGRFMVGRSLAVT